MNQQTNLPLETATRARGSPLPWLAIIGASLAIIIAIVFIWLNTERTDRRIIILAVSSLIILAALVGIYWLYNRARRASIVRLPNEHPLTVRQIDQQPLEFVADSLHGHYAAQIAAAQRPHPNLTTLHQSYSYEQDRLTAAPAQLTDEQPSIDAIPVDEWLGWIDRVPHVLLAAQTGDKSTGQGGKSTTAKAILAPRVQRGEDMFIIDPHSSGWFDLPVVGGGQNWAEIERAIQAVMAEYFRRMQERHAHLQQTGKELPHTHFPRLTVLMDEANEARRFLSRVEKRGDIAPWEYFTEVLGSGARKVGISVILMGQSATVDALGLDGSMRNNFTRIALDDRTCRQLIQQEEMDKKRRELLYAALVDRQFPAATARGSRVHLLDRAGLDSRPQPHVASGCVWAGWTPLQSPPATTVDARLDPIPNPVPASPIPVPPTVPLPPLTLEDEIILLLRTTGERASSRQIAEALRRDVSVVRTTLTGMRKRGTVQCVGPQGSYEYFVT